MIEFYAGVYSNLCSIEKYTIPVPELNLFAFAQGGEQLNNGFPFPLFIIVSYFLQTAILLFFKLSNVPSAGYKYILLASKARENRPHTRGPPAV